MNLKSSTENKDSDFRPSVQLATIDKLPANVDEKESQLTTVNLLPSKSVIPMTSVVYHPVYESPVNAGTVLVPILPSAKQPVKFIYDYQGQQNNQQLEHQQQQHDNESPDGSDESNPYHQLYGESYVLFHPSAQDTYASHDGLDSHHNQSSHEDLSVNNTPDDNRQEDNDDDADHETQQNHNSHPYKIISYQSPSGHHIPSEQVNLQNQNQPDHQEILSVPEVPGHESFSDTYERHPNLNKFHYHHHYKLPDSTYGITYPQKTQYIAVDPTPYHYQYAVPESSEIERPEMHPYYHNYYQQYHQSPVHIHHPEVVIDKPEAVVYLTSHRETSFTRTRKFPYKYYQPHEQGTQVHLPDQGYAVAPQHKRISPWNKIFHLIGAFLPLGLLIAALKQPNVVKIDGNASQPNIVLSKVRAVHLPVEHKTSLESYDEEEYYKETKNKYEDEDEYKDACENKSICEIILRGANKNSDILSTLLWNLRTKSTEAAKNNELEEIVAAVKKKIVVV